MTSNESLALTKRIEVDVLRVASFLFDLTSNAVKADSCERLGNPPSRHRNHLSVLVLILLSLAKAEEETLQRCQDLPFYLFVQPLVIRYESSFRATLLDMTQAFDILSCILLGPLVSEDTIEHAMLMSVQGWRLIFDSIDKIDPVEVASSALRIEFGVPKRRVVQRSCIIDGSTNLEFFPFESVIFKTDSKIYFDILPRVSKATNLRKLSQALLLQLREHGQI